MSKISALPALATVSGNEEVPVVVNGGNFKVPLSRVKSLVNKQDVGLGSVDNTSDSDKPISTAVQNALSGKANSFHNHDANSISGLSALLGAKADTQHSHDANSINGLQALLDQRALNNHGHNVLELTGFNEALAAKANVSHSHNISELTGVSQAIQALQTQINNKSNVLHGHGITDITGLSEFVTSEIQRLLPSTTANITLASITDLGNLRITSSQVTNFSTAVAAAIQNKADVGHTHEPYQINNLVDTVVSDLSCRQYPGLNAYSIQAFDARVLDILARQGGTNGDVEVGTMQW